MPSNLRRGAFVVALCLFAGVIVSRLATTEETPTSSRGELAKPELAVVPSSGADDGSSVKDSVRSPLLSPPPSQPSPVRPAAGDTVAPAKASVVASAILGAAKKASAAVAVPPTKAADAAAAALASAHHTPFPTRRKATDVPEGQTCRWLFVKYHPSEFERLWRENILEVQRSVCKSVANLPLKVFHDEYIAMLDRCAANKPSRPEAYPKDCATREHAPHENFPDRTFSKFEYAFVCAAVANPSDLEAVPLTAAMPRRYSYIEPLAGLLRHPKTCTGPPNTMFDKGYLVVDPWAAHRNDAYVAEGVSSSPRAGQVRSWYFDLGASTWSEGLGGASQDWFYSTYRDICVDFDRLLMWEVTPTKPRSVFHKIPGPLRPRYHWFNIPAGIAPGDWMNPLTYIQAETTPDDFVMLKIDIDTPRIELPLVEQIVKSPRIAALVDEFYFEHHVNMEIMGEMWNIKPTHPVYQNASIAVFSKLREMGVRAHSWI